MVSNLKRERVVLSTAHEHLVEDPMDLVNCCSEAVLTPPLKEGDNSLFLVGSAMSMRIFQVHPNSRTLVSGDRGASLVEDLDLSYKIIFGRIITDSRYGNEPRPGSVPGMIGVVPSSNVRTMVRMPIRTIHVRIVKDFMVLKRTESF